MITKTLWQKLGLIFGALLLRHFAARNDIFPCHCEEPEATKQPLSRALAKGSGLLRSARNDRERARNDEVGSVARDDRERARHEREVICDDRERVRNNRPKILICFVLSLIFLTLVGCSREATEVETIFTPLGLIVKGASSIPLSLYDDKGNLILSYPKLPGPDVLLVFPWKPEKTYLLKVGATKIKLLAPEKRPIAELLVLTPLGSPGERFIVYPESPLEAHFVVSSRAPCPEIGLMFTPYQDLKIEIASFKKNIPEGQRELFRQKVYLKDNEETVLKIKLENTPINLSFERRYVDLRGKIKVLAWHFPTDESGLNIRHKREGVLVIPNPLFEKIGYTLGIKERGYSRFLPFAYQTILLKNESPMPVNLLIKADFFDPQTVKKASGFYPPKFGAEGHIKEPLGLAYLPPHGIARVVLPVFAEIKPGEYLARIEVYPLGEKKPVLVKERLIGVTRGKPWLAASLFVILFCGLTISLGFLVAHQRVLRHFRVRELCLIALSGAVAFGLDFLGGMLSNIFHAILGPFNVLVGGLITEVTHYVVFTAIFSLVPKPGFVTLSYLMNYLMGLLLYGGMRATDPFFVGANIFFMEAMLLLLLVYQKPVGLRLVLALALADALQTFSSLVLHMTFYRLYFPDWYIWLSVGVKGFLYTLIGAGLGLKIGKLLREMER
ncbi:hypothetical protein [Thermodesulfatator autotrophicus]|uniref:Uncharacterized protein n=1 Tax=Thermodesulfatator autotrophicus TaxID=1795632 RepID=A0A177E732_9BACT|nr:hypothetical protein [Thermodesulfatator autotrophicus]OAG27757.1 hypothetical protein TH606_05225 [Thermodesulfatator autotrophicus]